MAFPPVFTDVWDITQPPDTQLANLLGQDDRNIKLDVMQRLSLLSGLFANRPTPETVNATWGGAGFGILYFSTDTKQIFQWNGGAWVDISSSFLSLGYKLEGTNIVPVTVANTTVATVLQTLPIAANDIGVGQTFYFDASGIIGDTAAAAITIQVFLDAVEIDVGGALIQLATVNNQLWSLRGFFTGLTTGVTGTISDAQFTWASSVSGGGFKNNATALGAAFNIDTTSAHNLTLKATWSTGNALNTITQNTFTCYRIG